ncbi:MAG: NAD-glutamate dehydrogenase [Sphingomonadales bacterium]
MNLINGKPREHKKSHVEKVLRYAADRLDDARAEEFARFIHLFCATLAPEEVLEFAVEDLYGAAFSAWAFAERREPGTAMVRAFNPNLEEHGWRSTHTIIEIANDDMPFLVDSVTAELTGLGRDIHLVNHPVMTVRRDGEGRRTAIFEPHESPAGQTTERDETIAESVMQIQVDEQTAPESLETITTRISCVLADVRAAVEDWRPMLDELDETITTLGQQQTSPVDQEELDEVIAFLEWLGDNHFTFLGFREYEFRGEVGGEDLEIVEGTGLGILRDPEFHVVRGQEGLAGISSEVRHFLQLPDPIIITKANVRSNVHRPVHLDYIGVKKFDDRGRLAGERRFIGLFTSVAYNRSTTVIPLLRRRVRRTAERAGFLPASHDQKALLNILENFPRDELFQISDEELYQTSLGILRLQGRPRPKAFLRPDRFERFVSVLAYVPREIHDTSLRLKVGAILAKAYNGSISAQYTQVGDDVLARLHFIVKTTPGHVPDIDPDEIDRQIAKATRTWSDHLNEALIARWGEERGNQLWSNYGAAFSLSYREDFQPEVALVDIEKFERLTLPDAIAFNIYRAIEDRPDAIRLKIYHASSLIPLSDCLPKLENMGLKVIEEQAYEIKRRDANDSTWMHDFYMVDSSTAELDLGNLKPRLEEAFARVWSGEAEDDGFNSLVLHVGLEWRQAVILRAYAKYLRQINSTFSQAYMESTLAGAPAITTLLIELFGTLFDPAVPGDGNGEKRSARIIRKIKRKLRGVASLDQDRIFRQFLNLIRSTLRTNYYQVDDDGGPKPYLSFKLDSREIEDLPIPRPWAEIFVYSPRVEGVHLRGGKVARGGLRWSDRREDFRTEILGLMKAQMVKNAVIVPVGAKGGFVPKQLPAEGGRDALMEEGIACYKTFIRGLLDLTDSLVEGEVSPPPMVVRRDDEDPYLVVAADKGTASLSDIANGVSAECGFWLGDAFASGGSAGYDHKKMGITARGAWVSVQRHFRELGVDVRRTPFTVIGIGDMSGDVFGNGMLSSKCIRLVGAFDHRHIFIDPEPDPATSFEERQRLFDLPRSSWADYNARLISKGGGVFDRTAKAIPLSAQMKGLLKVDENEVTPQALIRALLQVEADLLWIGGIGTYVKAHGEASSEVGDRANNALRVNGRDLRVKVVGEGGNLGLTQRGRIEFARAGGRLNTDFVDNSAGVDCSDHEVNIKILINALVVDGDMTGKQRNQLLEEMTDDVAEMVLKHNYRQGHAITIAESQGATLLDSQTRLMHRLERAGKLNRELESLPGDEDMAALQAAQRGLSRPEIAVLLSYAKMSLFDTLLESDVPDDSYLERDLLRAFPKPLASKFAHSISRHRLRREIIATLLSNSVINWVGPSFIDRIEEDTGMAPEDIVRAFVATREAFELPALWRGVDDLDNWVTAGVQTELTMEIVTLAHQQTIWFLNNAGQPLDIAATISAYAPGIKALCLGPESLLSDFEAQALRQKRAAWVDQGVPYELAHNIASLEPLESATDICFVANATGRTVEDVAQAYFELGSYLGLNWLRTAAEAIEAREHWSSRAVAYLIEDLYGQQRALTNRVLVSYEADNTEDALAKWTDRYKPALERSQNMITELKSSGNMTIAKLAYANRHVRGLLHNGPET